MGEPSQLKRNGVEKGFGESNRSEQDNEDPTLPKKSLSTKPKKVRFSGLEAVPALHGVASIFGDGTSTAQATRADIQGRTGWTDNKEIRQSIENAVKDGEAKPSSQINKNLAADTNSPEQGAGDDEKHTVLQARRMVLFKEVYAKSKHTEQMTPDQIKKETDILAAQIQTDPEHPAGRQRITQPRRTVEPDENGHFEHYGLSLPTIYLLVEFEARQRGPCFFRGVCFATTLTWRQMGWEANKRYEIQTNTWFLRRPGEPDLQVTGEENEMLGMSNRDRKDMSVAKKLKWADLAVRFIPQYYPESVKRVMEEKIRGTDPGPGLAHGQVYDRWAAMDDETFRKTGWQSTVILYCTELGQVRGKVNEELKKRSCQFFLHERTIFTSTEPVRVLNSYGAEYEIWAPPNDSYYRNDVRTYLVSGLWPVRKRGGKPKAGAKEQADEPDQTKGGEAKAVQAPTSTNPALQPGLESRESVKQKPESYKHRFSEAKAKEAEKDKLIAGKTEEILRLGVQVKEKSREAAGYEKDLQQLQEELDRRKTETEQCVLEKKHLQDRLEAGRIRLNDADNKYQILDRDTKEFQTTIKKLEKDKESLHSLLDLLKQQEADLQATIKANQVEYDQKIQEMDQIMTDRCGELESETQRQQRDIQTQQNASRELAERLSEMEETAAKATKKKEALAADNLKKQNVILTYHYRNLQRIQRRRSNELGVLAGVAFGGLSVFAIVTAHALGVPGFGRDQIVDRLVQAGASVKGAIGLVGKMNLGS